MPTPRAISRQFSRCSGVAFLSLGNHSSGTDTSRPSYKATTRASPLKWTVSARVVVGLTVLEMYKVLASPFHNGDLVVGQAVEFIDDLVDEPIGAADALDEIAVAGAWLL